MSLYMKSQVQTKPLWSLSYPEQIKLLLIQNAIQSKESTLLLAQTLTHWALLNSLN